MLEEKFIDERENSKYSPFHSWKFKMFSGCTITLFIIGLVICLSLPGIIVSQIKKTIIVDSEDSQMYDSWVDNRAEGGTNVYFDLYVFDILNPKEAVNGEKIHVVEKGPYSFKEIKIKRNVKFSSDGNIVSFVPQTYYVFDKERSSPDVSEFDTFTTMNLVLQGVHADPSTKVVEDLFRDNYPYVKDYSIPRALLCDLDRQNNSMYPSNLKNTPFVEVPVIRYFFGLKDDPMLERLINIAPTLLPISPDFPGMGTLNLSSYNDTLRMQGETVMFTGKNDTSRIQEYISWGGMHNIHVCAKRPKDNGDPTFCNLFNESWSEEEATNEGWVSPWNSSEASQIKGFDTFQFPMQESKDEILLFVDTLYRHAVLKDSIGKEILMDDLYDIPARRFEIDPKDLMNSTQNPANAAYGMNNPSGLFDFSKVSGGFPFYVSKPHFLDADSALVESIVGLKPNASLHNTYIMKNDLLGTVVKAHKALQLNGYLENWKFPSSKCSDDIRDFLPCCEVDQYENWDGNWNLNLEHSSDGKGTFVPMVYIIESGEATKSQGHDLNIAVFLHDKGPVISGIVIGVIALIYIVISTVIYCRRERSIKYDMLL